MNASGHFFSYTFESTLVATDSYPREISSFLRGLILRATSNFSLLESPLDSVFDTLEDEGFILLLPSPGNDTCGGSALLLLRLALTS